jgi:Limiting CO2-inducible proteins B/C beta carbonyic anhydrases
MKKKDKLAIIHQHYPNATTTIDSVNHFIDFVESQLDLEPAKIMLADSICSDDVNSIQYPARIQEFLGPFKMGGLDGFPFTGLTGMGAFASHVPDEGAVAIYYGPHIGITKDGIIGEIHRIGQSNNSSCCGAAKGALNKLMNNLIIAGNITELDYQMNTIEQLLFNEKERIVAAKSSLKEATEVMFEAIDKRIEELVAGTKYNCKYVILFGAILINSDTDMGSFTETRKLEVIDLKTGIRTNYLAM